MARNNLVLYLHCADCGARLEMLSKSDEIHGEQGCMENPKLPTFVPGGHPRNPLGRRILLTASGIGAGPSLARRGCHDLEFCCILTGFRGNVITLR